jgi:hypothetical protein
MSVHQPELEFEVLFTQFDQSLIHFTPHFLDRYNERFLKNENPNKIELLKRFVPKNTVQSIKIDQNSSAGGNKIFGRFNEGIGLGYMESFNDTDKVILHFKTFISNDMIYKDQLEDFNFLGDQFNKHWTENNNWFSSCA